MWNSNNSSVTHLHTNTARRYGTFNRQQLNIWEQKWTATSQFLITSLKMPYDATFVPEIFTTYNTAKLFVARMYQMMSFQLRCSTETLWTFTANIRLHTFMLKWVTLQFTTCNEFLFTNVTREPSTFIVWLQQMSLQLVRPSKSFWAVSTWVRLCISVKTNMRLQFNACLKLHSTVRTLMRSSVAV